MRVFKSGQEAKGDWQNLYKEGLSLFSCGNARSLACSPPNLLRAVPPSSIHPQQQPACSFLSSSSRTSQHGREGAISIGDGSQLYSTLKKRFVPLHVAKLLIGQCLKDFRSEIGLHFKILVLKICWVLSIASLAHLVSAAKMQMYFAGFRDLLVGGNGQTRLSRRGGSSLSERLSYDDTFSQFCCDKL